VAGRIAAAPGSEQDMTCAVHSHSMVPGGFDVKS
jgi:hypothetical protein